MRVIKVKKPQLTLSEKEIEKQILIWLNMQPHCKAWKNKSTGTYDPVRQCFRRPSSRFTEKGSADILGIWGGYFLAIECKSAKGRVSDDQKKWLKAMQALGAICIVARSLDDVIMALGDGDNQGQNTHFC